MRSVIIRLFFGADEMVAHATKLFSLRRKAQEQHAANKELEASLALGREQLATHKTQYAFTKAALEAAYNLELT